MTNFVDALKEVITYKAQADVSTPASGSGGQALSKSSGAIKVTPKKYNIERIKTSQMSSGETHGAKDTSYSYSDNLSCLTHDDFYKAALRTTFAAVTPITGAGLTIAGTLGAYTVTRAAGDWLADGIKVGQVVRLSAGALHANNINKNLIVTAIGSATAFTCKTANDSVMTAEGPITGCTITVIGKVAAKSLTAATITAFTIEEWDSVASLGSTATGLQVSDVKIEIPEGNGKVSIDFIGLDATLGAAAQVLTTPTAALNNSVLNCLKTQVCFNNVWQPYISNVSINIKTGVTAISAVHNTTATPGLNQGIIGVEGTIEVLYADGVMVGYNGDDTARSLNILVFESSSATSDFMSFIIPLAKITTDGPKGSGTEAKKVTFNFTAQDSTVAAGAATYSAIMALQDSKAV